MHGINSEPCNKVGEKYKNWFNKYIPKLAPSKYGKEGKLKAEDLYNIRCSLLHQGQTNNQIDYKRLLFIEGAEEWHKEMKSDDNYKNNSSRLIKRYPNGIEPMTGMPLIG